MRRENFETMPSEISEEASKSTQEELIEVKDNVVEIRSKEKPVEHAVEHIMGEVGSHERSMYELDQLGYSTLEDARTALVNLRKEKQDILENINKHVMFSAVGKLKDRIFNQGAEVAKLTDIESRIHKLESAVRFTQATQHMSGIEGEQSQEFKKAA